MRESKKYCFGIIGCGMVAHQHAGAIKLICDAELVGVCDIIYENAQSFATEQGCTAFKTPEELLGCDKIDIVCICTPSGLHAEMAVMAANAGKHFVVEKPMAITENQLESIISACEKNNVKGAVISQHRVADTVAYVKRAIDDGLLGDIISGDLTMKYYRSPEYYASASWRGTWALDGGGVLMNQGIHGIDILQYLMGQVKSVYAICKTLARDIEVEDTAVILLEYGSGAVGTVNSTTAISPGYPRVISINGTKGSVEITEDTITRWDIDGECARMPESRPNTTTFRNPKALAFDSHRAQLEDMIDAVKNGRRPVIDIYEGRRPVDIILAAYKSSRLGEKVLL